jgi:hypothetical protein
VLRRQRQRAASRKLLLQEALRGGGSTAIS